jgi:predicted flap endonuclease-1-like 5' DNA nuclease
MFQSLFQLDTFKLAILRDTLLFSSVLVAWVYWRMQRQEQGAKFESLDTQSSQREETISGLTTRITKKDNSIILLKSEVNALEKRNQDSLARARVIEARVGELKKRLKGQETDLEGLRSQLSQRDETIRAQVARIEESHNSSNHLKGEVASLERRNHDSLARAEDAESRVGDLVSLVEEKEREIAALQARTRAMQDDFAIIVGIGPRVSSILRSAGINTFEKLAAAEESRLRDILEAENPSLLRLTNPSTWSEQARLVVEGDLELFQLHRKN